MNCAVLTSVNRKLRQDSIKYCLKFSFWDKKELEKKQNSRTSKWQNSHPQKNVYWKKYKIILIPCKVTGHSFGKFLKQLYLDTGNCKIQLIIYNVISCKKHGFSNNAHL